MKTTEWFDLFAGMMIVSTTAVVLAGSIGVAVRRRAASRHAVWLCALGVVLLSPAFAWLGRAAGSPRITWPRPSAPVELVVNRPEPRPADLPRAALPIVDSVERASIPRSGVDRGAERKPARFERQRTRTTAVGGPALHLNEGTRSAIVMVWLLGALGLLGRLAWGAGAVATLRRSARPFASDGARARVASVFSVGVGRLPAIGVSERTSQPLTFGVVRPLVLLPEGLTERLSAVALRDVLIHECAHALRRDAVVGLLQRFAAVVCWPNPLVHLMNRELETAREELCDNHVLRASSPADYASSLLAVAELRSLTADRDAWLGLPMIAQRGSLESRIAALIDPRRHVGTSIRIGAVAALALLFLVAGGAAAAFRFDDAEQAPFAPSSKPLDPTKTRIEGVVVDEAGKPARGVTVQSWAVGGEAPETRTDAAGRFVLDVEPSPLFHLLASKLDGSSQAFHRHVGGYMASERRLTARMVLEPARLTTARVTDLHGAPIADASVVVHDEFAAFWRARTDATGKALIRVASNARPWAAYAFKPGAGLDYFEDEQYWPGRGFGPCLKRSTSSSTAP